MWPKPVLDLRLFGQLWRPTPYFLLNAGGIVIAIGVALLCWRKRASERLLMIPLATLSILIGYWTSVVTRAILEGRPVDPSSTHSAGWLAGGLLGLWIFSRLWDVNLLRALDWIGPSYLIGSAFGRVGCLAEGCCRGFECGGWYCASLPAIDPTGAKQYFPVQLVSAAWDLAASLIVMTQFRPRAKHAGSVAFLSFLLYSIGRLFLDSFREQERILGPLSATQSFYLAFILGLLHLAIIRKWSLPSDGSLWRREGDSEPPASV